MRRALPVLLLLFLPAPAAAQAKVRGEATYPPYKRIVLKAADVTSAKASFLWDVDGDADVVEAGDTLYVWAPPGSYRVRLTAVDFESKKVERARFSFRVEGDAPPSPPGPGPGPGPKPEPTDPLYLSLKAAWAQEADPGKTDQKANLAALYRQAAATAAQEPAQATWGALFKVMAKAAETLGLSGKLPRVQAAVQAELKARLPATAASPLDAAGRELARAAFLKIASALEAIK